MAWRGPHPMLLLVLLATWLALAWGQTETPFEKFQRQHVAPPRPDHQDKKYQTVSTYCNDMMQRQGMTSPTCTLSNTFIHVNNVKTITDVCGRGGTPVYDNLRDSNALFHLTICKHRGATQTPPCEYSETTSTQRIRIACDEDGDPVRYNRSI